MEGQEMGSRIMHLIISQKIAERIAIKDKASFLAGGIAPDAALDKEHSHFYAGQQENYTRRIDYTGFLEKYNTHKEQSYILGYYTHLIADDLWLQGFYLPWLKNRMENDQNLGRLYHQDFMLLNGQLLAYYSFNESILPSKATIVNLEEVTEQEVMQFLPYVQGDMVYDEDMLKQNLQVFTLPQIIGYIETSVEKGQQLMKELV